jgi:hypothetical protein
MMKEKNFSGKKEKNKVQILPSTINKFKSNNTDKTKSQSLNKCTVSIDKEQILKEFYLYKLSSTNAISKSDKNKFNKSFTKSSKSKTSKEKTLIPVRSAKDVKNVQSHSIKNYTTNKNLHNNNRKQEQLSYEELLKSKILIKI